MPNHRPWYEEWENECKEATSLIWAYQRVRAPFGLIPSYDDNKLPKLKAEIEALEELTRLRLIYESNLLERAGLSESDTKKLLLEDKTFSNPEKVRKLSKDLLKDFHASPAESKQHSEARVFEGKKRTEKEVIRHLMAILTADLWAFELAINRLQFRKPNRAMSKKDEEKTGTDLSPGILSKSISLFTTLGIRKLHFLIAQGLLPRDAMVDAGFWRIDNRTTDFQTAFPAPENVPKAMELLVHNANRLMESKDNPIVIAAKISYDFVAIHPFPDFNGRMSRLIMNMVLRAYGLPFYAVLRGNAKEKHRYLTALRHANRGKITSYAALIARAINESFEQLNSNLKKAGLKPIGD